MVCVALFVFFFGSVIAMQAIEFGFRVGDKALEASGTLAKLPFKIAFKLIRFAGKYLIKRLMKNKPEEVVIKPVFAVTPLELQQMRNNNLLQSGKRQPVLIEHPPQQTK
jgi:hypothetical protein